MNDFYAYFEKQYQHKKENHENGWQNETDDKELINWFRELLSKVPPQGNRILEIGCGAGNISAWLASLGFSVVGIDVSYTAIRWAKERFTTLNLSGDFICADLTTKVNLNVNKFDFVIDSLCFHCIIGEDRNEVLKNIGRLLKNDGLFYCVTMCGNPKPEILSRHFDEKTRCTLSDGVPTRYLGFPDDILIELEAANFTVLWHKIVISDNTDGQDMLISINRINK